MSRHTLVLAGCRAWTSHLVKNLVDGLTEFQVTEDPIHWVIVGCALPQENGSITKLELNDRPSRQSQLFAQRDRNRELSLGGDRAFHHE
jgi:hypothetical protein